MRRRIAISLIVIPLLSLPVWAVLLVSGIAQAALVPSPNPTQGDGGVSPFYTWTNEIPAAAGQMLRAETLDAAHGLAMAGEQYRILYTSTDGMDGKTTVTVSGAYFQPRGTPPSGGWPLVAWAHGTTGVADKCAPSWLPRSERDSNYLNTWLEQGYAIVATDYQGLGTQGPHPYLVVRPEAYSVLDSLRAVLKAFPNLARTIIVIGQSQGAQAAFATAGIASHYAPELDIRGIVATGLPFFGPAILQPPTNAAAPEQADPTVAYSLYIGLMIQQVEPAKTAKQLVTARALPLFKQARTTCAGRLFRDVQKAGLNRDNALTSGFVTALSTILPTMQYSTFHLPMPVFIGIGEQDHDVPPADQLALVRNACAEGSVVEAHLYLGQNHGGTVKASLKNAVPFVRKVLAGEPIRPICTPVAE